MSPIPTDEIEQCEVFLNEVFVGTLVFFPPAKCIFTLAESYIKQSRRPTLSLPLRDLDEQKLEQLLWKGNVILPPFFSNLLPEGPLRNYLAELNRINPKREFYLLTVLGKDLPGAVKVGRTDRKINSRDLQRFETEKFGAGEERLRLRFSLGGVQLKFSAVMDAAGGLTIPVAGIGGSWIVKLSSSELPGVSENEYSMLTLAKQIGIDAAECQLTKSDNVSGLPQQLPQRFHTCLAVKRFDRYNGKRIHTEDLAQVFGVWTEDKYSRKIHYNHIAKLIWQFIDESALREFIRRIVFNIAICNTDMHLKNWSLIYRDGVNPTLAPAYDLVSTYTYVGHREMALKLGRTREMTEVNIYTFHDLAELAGLPRHIVLDSVSESVLAFKKVWKESSNDLPIPKDIRHSIEEHMRLVPLFWQV